MTVASKSQADSILEFASHLSTKIQHLQSVVPNELPNAQPYTSILPLASTEFSKSGRAALRENALSIWNGCNLIVASTSAPATPELAKIRAFAYLLLLSITSSTSKKGTSRVKLFQSALTVVRECAHANVLDLAGKILEIEAGTLASLRKGTSSFEDDQEHTSGVVEYHFLRLLWDWRRGRSDLADHQYSQVIDVPQALREEDVERVVDLFHEIGTQCLADNNAQNAVKWLDRAVQMLAQNDYAETFTGSDLRLNTVHALVRSLICLPDHRATLRAHQLLSQLRNEHGPKLPIVLLALEVAFKQPTIDADAVSSQLEGIIHTVHLIDANHRVIMHYLECLTTASPMHASQCLKHYINQRLLSQGQHEWIEKALISYLASYCAQKLGNPAQDVQDLQQELNDYADALKFELSIPASQAAHVVIWKMIRETDDDGSRSLAMLWCQVGLHRIFESAGEASIGRLERQLISYHLLVSNTGLAHQMLDQMSFSGRSNKHSRYLAYCLAVRTGDEDEAQSCLNTITNGPGDTDHLIFACVGESIKYAKPMDTARLLQRLIDKHTHTTPSKVDVGVLLKYTATTLLEVIKNNCQPHPEILTRLCMVFRNASRLQQAMRNSSGARSVTVHVDSPWFQRKSFELATTHTEHWPRRYTIDLLEYSGQLSDSPISGINELALPEDGEARLRDTKYLQAILYATEARNMPAYYSIEDLPLTSYDSRSKPKTSECQMVLYQQLFKLFTTLQQRSEAQLLCSDDERQDMRGQLQTLTPLAFEALLSMNTTAYLSEDAGFDEISIRQFLTTVQELEAPAATYALLADIVLAFATGDDSTSLHLKGEHLPAVNAAILLGHIIQALGQTEKCDVEQAARWIRCVAQLLLNGIEVDLANSVVKEKSKYELSLSMLDAVLQQAIALARTSSHAEVETFDEHQSSSIPSPDYPTEELEWLATKLFNMTIDFLSSGMETLAEQWAVKATEVADLVDGVNGGLSQLLRAKMSELGWAVPT